MSSQQDILNVFFTATLKDSRINKGHLAVFTALIYLWSIRKFPDGLSLFGKEVMEVSKISSTATYHRIIKELNEYGYLKYEPSFFRGKASSIYFHIEAVQ